ncbi:MAG: extracellular solute-binding protein [Clostridiales bacterium]|nr:extracellular solute-binding protein [Clostridiales bacterium]
MKRNKVLAFALSIALLVPTFAACGSSSKDSAATSSAAASTAAASSIASAEKTEISLWTWSPIPRTAEKMISAFETANPNIKINYTNYNYNPEYLAALAAASASNTMADIVGLQPGSLTQQYRDYLTDLTPYATKSWGDKWEDKIYKINADQIRLGNPKGDNGAYMLPIESQIINIWYNKKLFEEAGAKVPTTWAELKDASKKLTDKGYAPLYFGGADGWQHVNMFLMLANQFGDDFYKAQDGSGKWNTPNLVKALEAYQDMYKSGIMQAGALSNNAYPDGVNLFISGKVGMMALGSWWTQEFTAENPAPNVKDWVFGNFLLPAYEDGGNASPAIGGVDFGYGISKDCKNPDVAWKVLESFAAGEGIQQAINDLNNLPAFKGIEPQGNLPQVIKDQVNAAASLLDSAKNQRIGSPEIENALQNALSGVAAGQLTPAKALDNVQKVQDEVLAK